MALAANLALQDARRNLCRDIFSAPLVKGTFPQPSDLQNVANDYARAADALRQAGCGDIAMQCEGIKQAVSNSVVPSQNDALASLRIFAEKQPDVPPIPLQQSEWEKFCAVRMEAVKDGRAKTDLCYKSIHDVQNSSSKLHDNLTARVSELHIIMSNLENQIRQAEEDKARALQNPFGAIGQLIQELVERLKGMYQERGRRYEEMNYVQSSTQRAEYCLQQVTSLGNATATVDSMWNSMQTQMITAADVWPVLHEVKLSDLEIGLYESTWNAVRNALGN